MPKKMGGGSVNPATGSFNFTVNEGYIIRNGEICEPVRGACLIGKGSDIIMDIDMEVPIWSPLRACAAHPVAASPPMWASP